MCVFFLLFAFSNACDGSRVKETGRGLNGLTHFVTLGDLIDTPRVQRLTEGPKTKGLSYSRSHIGFCRFAKSQEIY